MLPKSQRESGRERETKAPLERYDTQSNNNRTNINDTNTDANVKQQHQQQEQRQQTFSKAV